MISDEKWAAVVAAAPSRQGQKLGPLDVTSRRTKFIPDNPRPFDPFTQASTAGEAPLAANDDGPLDSAFYAQMWGDFAMRRLDLIEARVAKLEKRHQLRVVGGDSAEADIAHVRHELALMDIAVAGFFGLPIPDDLPDDLHGMR